MTDLLHVVPNFPTTSYTHLIPSLEKHRLTTTDLLTLDALDIAKRAQLPLLDVRRLAKHIIAELHGDLAFGSSVHTFESDESNDSRGTQPSLSAAGNDLVQPWKFITTLHPAFDDALGGGIPAGYLSEVVGERFMARL